MLKKPSQKRVRILCAILLICLGLLIIIVPVIYQYRNCADRWLQDLDAFGKKYDAVWDCFWSRSKGAILISLVSGFIPITAGIELGFRKNSTE